MPDAPVVEEAQKIADTQELTTFQKLDKKIIYGKKVVLFAFEPADLPHFVKLHREDKNGYMQQYCLKKMTEEEAIKFCAVMLLSGQIKCWSVYVKNNSLKNVLENKRAGFIFLHNFTSFSCAVSGIMDVAIMKGLLKHMRHGEVTYAEDTMRTMLNYCFEVGLSRVETTVLANNRRALTLDKKCGFIEEGHFRKAFQMDNGFFDVIQLAVLKEDLRDGKK